MSTSPEPEEEMNVPVQQPQWSVHGEKKKIIQNSVLHSTPRGGRQLVTSTLCLSFYCLF